MSKLSELIDVLTLYINKQSALAQQNHFLTTEIIAIIAAALSFCGLVFTTVYTVKQNSKLRNANARIEWIQKVRDVTAEIISSYSSALNEDDPSHVQKIIIEVREKIERLILFFGHETTQKEEVDIYDKYDNDGKNDLIIAFLTELSNDFITYNKNVKSGILTQAEAHLNDIGSILYNMGVSNIEEEKIAEETYISVEYEILKGFEKEFNIAHTDVDKINEFNRELDIKLVKLRDLIRIYLKIEWNKAKMGK